MDKNCWERPCKHCDSCSDVLICRHSEQIGWEVDELLGNCLYFEEAQTCLSCSHAIRTTHELGEIDSVDYACPFTDTNRPVYSDTRPFSTHFFDVPLCVCDRFEFKED